MLCSAMTGHRQDFDKFLGFYEKHLNKNGLMCWQQVQAYMHSPTQQLVLHEALAVSCYQLRDTMQLHCLPLPDISHSKPISSCSPYCMLFVRCCGP